MKSFRSLAKRCGGALLVVGLLVVPAASQEPGEQTPQAPQSQPAAPEAYRLDIRNVLAYQVISTTRVGQATPTSSKYREMVVFDVDEEGNLIACIGSPDLKTIAAQGSADQQTVPSGDHKPNGEEPEKVPMKWKRHVLGKDFTRNEDGTISFRPPQNEVMPYPVLPLPPTTLKDKEHFSLTLPDLAMGEGKTLQMIGQHKVSQDGKLTVQCRLETKGVPGIRPEMAIVGYDIPADASAVSHVRITRRPAGEVAHHSAGEMAHRPANEGHAGRPTHAGSNRERPAPRPAAVAAPQSPTTTLLLQLVSSQPAPERLRKEVMKLASGDTSESGDHVPEDAAPQRPSNDDAAPTPARTGPVEHARQLGEQLKEKSQDAAN